MATTQKSKLGTTTGSFFNYLMGNNQTIPVVGKGATVLHWTDRSAYEVIEADEAKMTCKIQRYDPERVDTNGMSEDQAYKYEKLTGEVWDLVYRNGSWRKACTEIRFDKSILDENGFLIKGALTEEQRIEIYAGEVYPQKVIAGLTKLHKVYPKVNILFGFRREYYDYTF